MRAAGRCRAGQRGEGGRTQHRCRSAPAYIRGRVRRRPASSAAHARAALPLTVTVILFPCPCPCPCPPHHLPCPHPPAPPGRPPPPPPPAAAARARLAWGGGAEGEGEEQRVRCEVISVGPRAVTQVARQTPSPGQHRAKGAGSRTAVRMRLTTATTEQRETACLAPPARPPAP